jgi:hypothetical protein
MKFRNSRHRFPRRETLLHLSIYKPPSDETLHFSRVLVYPKSKYVFRLQEVDDIGILHTAYKYSKHCKLPMVFISLYC